LERLTDDRGQNITKLLSTYFRLKIVLLADFLHPYPIFNSQVGRSNLKFGSQCLYLIEFIWAPSNECPAVCIMLLSCWHDQMVDGMESAQTVFLGLASQAFYHQTCSLHQVLPLSIKAKFIWSSTPYSIVHLDLYLIYEYKATWEIYL